MEAYNTQFSRGAEWQLTVASDPILSAHFDRVRNGETPDEFDSLEHQRLVLMYRVLIRHWEVVYRSVEEGVLGDPVLDAMGAGGAFDNSWFRSVWRTELRASFGEDFSQFLESLPWNGGALPDP